MSKTVIETSKAPAPVGPYSQAIQLSNGFLYCSGQIPLDAEAGEVFTGAIPEQTKMSMENVRAVLTEAGCDFSNIIKTTIFLTDMSDFAAVNEVYAGYFSDQPPARSCVAVKTLPKNVNVEVEVIAFKG